MTMAYSITTAEAQDITIGVYDINGRLVRELVSGNRTPGEYVATWDGLDRNGAAVRGGLYFVLGRIGGVRVQSHVTIVR
jgi:flagellar hook assembly protein FlgD